VFASVGLGSSRPRRDGLVVTRSDPLGTPAEREALPIDSPLDVLIACGRDLEELDLAVLAASAIFSGAITHEDLVEGAATARRRGAPRLRRALKWVDGRAESPYEVLLATLHRSCDVPVTAQHEVCDGTGAFVARADLRIDGTRRLPEYDGSGHLEVAQQREDLRRVRALNGLGWDRRGYTQHEVLRTPHAILRDADDALDREHDPARLRPWLGLVRVSLFTPAGRARLSKRAGSRAAQELVGPDAS
jgi:hypothetical protein